MALVTLLDWGVLEPLGLRWLPANRVVDGAWIALILAAQARDDLVNQVTVELFKKYRTAEDYALAPVPALEEQIRKINFYRNKARSIHNSCSEIAARFGGKVPDNLGDLISLPGVGRKTANIVLYNAYGITAGIAVDTHVTRLSARLGLTEQKDQNKIEKDLMQITPKEKWMKLTDLLIFHGRQICTAKKPKCEACVLNKICPSAFTFG